MAVDPTLAAAQQQAQAAWMQVDVAIAQAVLTIAALAIAIAIPWWQQRSEIKRRARSQYIEARELANSILLEVSTWSQVVGALAHFARSQRIDEVHARVEHAVAIPQRVQTVLGRLHILGEAALPLQDAVYLSNAIDIARLEYAEVARGEFEGVLADFCCDQMHRSIFKLKALIIVADEALLSLFADVPDPDGPRVDGSEWQYKDRVDELVYNDLLGY